MKIECVGGNKMICIKKDISYNIFCDTQLLNKRFGLS